MARHDIRGLKLSDGTYSLTSKDVYNLNDNFIQLSQEVFGNSNFSKDLGKQVKKNTASIEAITSTVGNLEADYVQVIQDVDNLSLAVVDADGKALNAQATADAVTLEFKNSVSGGKNLLEKTDTMEQWQVFTGAVLDTINGWVLLQANGSFPYAKIPAKINRNEDYIFSVDIYTSNVSDANAIATHWKELGAPSWIKKTHDIGTNTGVWVRVEMPIRIAGSGVADIEITVDCYGAASGTIWYRRPKLEQGNKMSGWTPNSNEFRTLTHIFDNQGYTMKDSNGEEILSISKGIANEQNIGRVDNIESGYPMKVPFHIGSEVSQIRQAVLKWDMSSFRTYSKGAASGGGTKTTPSGGAGTAGTTWGSSGVAEATSAVTAGTLPHQHTIALSKLAHSHSTPSHTHSMDITHSHDPIYGILEVGLSDNLFDIYVDGVYRASVGATRGERDLSAWITTNGWHVVELRTGTLKRIDANLFLKTYIRR